MRYLLTLAVVLAAAFAAEDDLPQLPDSLDPLNPGAGDFLDLDAARYSQAAWRLYQDGDYAGAAAYYLHYLARDAANAGQIYNLACCYGLLGEAELASRYIERAYSAGFDDVGWIAEDPDFQAVRETAVFAATLDSLTRLQREERALQGRKILVSADTYLPVNVREPEDFDPAQPVDLIIALHGYGATPQSFCRIYDRFRNPDFVMACPRAPYPVSSSQGWSWMEMEPATEMGGSMAAKSAEYVMACLDELDKAYDVDRVFLLGFSQGCGMTYITGLSNPEAFEGLICFGGWLDTDFLSPRTLQAASAGPRVFVAHGSEDGMVDTEAGLEACERLEELGYDLQSYIFDGGHEVPEEALLRVQEWM